MWFSTTNVLNFTAIAGAVTLMVFGAQGTDHFANGADGVDTMTTASVTAHSGAQPLKLADQFTALNHADGRSCVVKLHRADGYDVHRIEPSQNCASVSQQLAKARAWQETANGLVNIVDHKGENIMRLVRGDGFAWEVIQPSHINISLEAF